MSTELSSPNIDLTINALDDPVETIKSIARQLAQIYHPDKEWGNPEKFKRFKQHFQHLEEKEPEFDDEVQALVAQIVDQAFQVQVGDNPSGTLNTEVLLALVLDQYEDLEEQRKAAKVRVRRCRAFAKSKMHPKMENAVNHIRNTNLETMEQIDLRLDLLNEVRQIICYTEQKSQNPPLSPTQDPAPSAETT